MTVINASACSPQFSKAVTALSGGKSVRLNEWPAGMFLAKHGDRIAVFRNSKLSSPQWLGPSSAESDSDGWEVIGA